MLEPVPPPQTADERFAALFEHRNIVARCPLTGATLEASRKQWILAYGYERRFKSNWNSRECRAVTVEEAIAWANRALARIVNLQEGPING